MCYVYNYLHMRIIRNRNQKAFVCHHVTYLSLFLQKILSNYFLTIFFNPSATDFNNENKGVS